MVFDDRLQDFDLARVSAYGLALVPFLAGLTKFTHPVLWQGYEPAAVTQAIQAAGLEPLMVFGVLETLLGLALFVRRDWRIAAAVTVWLAAITARVAYLELWDLAIRDLGLTFYALTVTLLLYRRG